MVVYKKSNRTLPEVARRLVKGDVVAAPTETAYGLLADALNHRAVAAVVKLKGREPGKPIALVSASLPQVKKFFHLSATELKLARKFWPGPLTLLLKPKRKFPRSIVGRGGLVGVRVPGGAWLRMLCSVAGNPLTATSANRATKPTPYSTAAVRRELGQRGLRYLVDAGRLPRRPTSTVAAVRQGKLMVIRVGAVPEQRLRRALSV